MTILNASNYSTIADFSDALRAVAHHNEPAFLIVNGDVLMILPADVAKEQIAGKIAMRLAENPSILSDLQNRLATEAPEKWD